MKKGGCIYESYSVSVSVSGVLRICRLKEAVTMEATARRTIDYLRSSG